MPSPFLIEEILPTNEVHLLAGPSGAGKTRWLFDTLIRWSAGHPILGHKSYPVPWVYVAADRSLKSVARTIQKLGIAPELIQNIPAWDEQLNYGQIFDRIDASGAKLAIIESFGSFVDPPGNGINVKNFLRYNSFMIRKRDITIIGVVESPKMKPYEKYENPRQRVSGAAAWGHFSDTIFLVEPGNVKSPKDPARILYVCPRNAPSIELEGGFQSNGHLIFPF